MTDTIVLCAKWCRWPISWAETPDSLMRAEASTNNLLTFEQVCSRYHVRPQTHTNTDTFVLSTWQMQHRCHCKQTLRSVCFHWRNCSWSSSCDKRELNCWKNRREMSVKCYNLRFCVMTAEGIVCSLGHNWYDVLSGVLVKAGWRAFLFEFDYARCFNNAVYTCSDVPKHGFYYMAHTNRYTHTYACWNRQAPTYWREALAA